MSKEILAHFYSFGSSRRLCAPDACRSRPLESKPCSSRRTRLFRSISSPTLRFSLCIATVSPLSTRPHQPMEHPVDHDAGDGNIKPDRKGPAGDAPVRWKFFSQCPNQRDDCQWHHRDGQDRVCEEDCEIDGADPALALKRHGTDLVMINEVGNQEQDRASEGNQHAGAMGALLLRSN